jgi:hypothetical protein
MSGIVLSQILGTLAAICARDATFDRQATSAV